VCAPYIRISEPERMRAPAHGGKGDQGNDTPILFVRVSTGRRSLVFYRTRRSDTWPICHGAQRRQGGTRAMGEGRRCKVKLIKEPSGGRCHVKQPLRETVGQIVPMNPAAPVRGPKHVVKDRQDAGARGRRMAQITGLDPDHDVPRSARPRLDRHPHLQLCLGHAAMISASEFV
jgi:hypothetical protein